MRVGLPHLGQSVLLVVSIIFLRSAVLAILAMVECSPECLWFRGLISSATANAAGNFGDGTAKGGASNDRNNMILH
jgi:hypothetical protein